MTAKKKKTSKDLFLAVDIGNTDTSVGVFSGSVIRCTFRYRTVDRTADEIDTLLSMLLDQHGVVGFGLVVDVALVDHGKLVEIRGQTLDLCRPGSGSSAVEDGHDLA